MSGFLSVIPLPLFRLSDLAAVDVTFTPISGQGTYAFIISGAGQLTDTITGQGQV